MFHSILRTCMAGVKDPSHYNSFPESFLSETRRALQQGDVHSLFKFPESASVAVALLLLSKTSLSFIKPYTRRLRIIYESESYSRPQSRLHTYGAHCMRIDITSEQMGLHESKRTWRSRADSLGTFTHRDVHASGRTGSI